MKYTELKNGHMFTVVPALHYEGFNALFVVHKDMVHRITDGAPKFALCSINTRLNYRRVLL